MTQLNSVIRSIELALCQYEGSLQPAEQVAIQRIAEILFTSQLNEDTAAILSTILETGGLGRRWNRILDCQRATRIADQLCQIIPLNSPKVLDLFSGTGTVGTALLERGWDVVAVEKKMFPHSEAGSLQCFDYEYCRDSNFFSESEFDVVLIVTSLHHEPDLDEVLGWITQLKTKRIVVVENLRCESITANIHCRFDWFFNHCLNDFHAPCPGWYWTQGQWEACLSTLGSPNWLLRDEAIPGIPFPYDYFMVIPKHILESNIL
ncbi:class I SAM-dependent methyltransferase [Photobacterium sp. 53610]|uniref:class I SAM-dependent methyltransferase n=1 Tax=Photobacterium sp. 53610 TaxID=3102789 RepID=UPI002EDADD2D